MDRIENARIKSVSISMADHDCLTFGIVLDGKAWGCVYGGYAIGDGYLGADDDFFKARSNGAGLVAMMKIMDTVGVERWEDLVDKYVRVVVKGGSSPIKIIGNIVEDKWFDIGEFFKNYSSGKA